MGNRRRVRVTALSRLCPRPAKAGRDSDSEIVSTQYLRMKDANMYEALWAYCVWKHGKTNGRYPQSFRPGNYPHSEFELAIGNRRAARHRSVLHGGILPQAPWDLTLSRQDCRARESPWENPISSRGIPASESALGSHPCVALSSAQVTISLERNEGEKNIR
jgi:hypothetical protein